MPNVKLIAGTALTCMAAAAVIGCGNSTPTDEITVKRINIVDESGAIKFVIAGQAPDAIVRGERKERSVDAAGIIWYDRNGDESGGLAVAPVSGWKGAPPGAGRVRMLTFDFTHQITDAVRLDTFESDDGNTWSGGLTVFDRRPYRRGPVQSSQGTERIHLGTRNGDAGLVIRDANERERIRLAVSPDGVALIEILDENGRVVHRVPER